MIKSELVARIAERHPDLYHRDVETIVNAVLGGIADALARGDRVEIRGFGAFSVKRRDARDGRNPRTGDAVAVAEKAVPVFKAGKEMRERLNPSAERPKPKAAKDGTGKDGSARQGAARGEARPGAAGRGRSPRASARNGAG